MPPKIDRWQTDFNLEEGVQRYRFVAGNTMVLKSPFVPLYH